MYKAYAKDIMESKCLLEISASQQYLNQSSDFRKQLSENTERRFKVHGESLVVAIVGGPAADKITTHTENNNTHGTVQTKCTPLINYDDFAKNSLGVTEAEVEKKGITPSFDKEKETYWIQIDIGYQGHTLEELQKAWHDEAVAALGLLHGGAVPMALYKSVFMRQVHLFVQMPAVALDQLHFQLPLFRALGDQVKTVTKRITVL